MNIITKMTSDERKTEFEAFLKKQVKSATKYINALEKGFSEAPLKGFNSIYDITDPDLLEDLNKTKKLRESKTFTRDTVGGTSALAGLNWYIKYLKYSRDSYYDFMNYFGIKPKDLFQWGMDAIIFPPKEEVDSEWNNLKQRIFNGDEVIIRGYGRDAAGTSLYIGFYEYLLNNKNVKKDSNNNSRPQRNIKNLTGLKRNKDIYNYQVSHIWGKTKNIFLFEAPWNVCYTPKIIDPFTGHETKGDLPRIFQETLIETCTKKYRKYIIDYNKIISALDIPSCLNSYCQEKGIHDDRFYEDALAELSQIQL